MLHCGIKGNNLTVWYFKIRLNSWQKLMAFGQNCALKYFFRAIKKRQ